MRTAPTVDSHHPPQQPLPIPSKRPAAALCWLKRRLPQGYIASLAGYTLGGWIVGWAFGNGMLRLFCPRQRNTSQGQDWIFFCAKSGATGGGLYGLYVTISSWIRSIVAALNVIAALRNGSTSMLTRIKTGFSSFFAFCKSDCPQENQQLWQQTGAEFREAMQDIRRLQEQQNVTPEQEQALLPASHQSTSERSTADQENAQQIVPVSSPRSIQNLLNRSQGAQLMTSALARQPSTLPHVGQEDNLPIVPFDRSQSLQLIVSIPTPQRPTLPYAGQEDNLPIFPFDRSLHYPANRSQSVQLIVSFPTPQRSTMPRAEQENALQIIFISPDLLSPSSEQNRPQDSPGGFWRFLRRLQQWRSTPPAVEPNASPSTPGVSHLLTTTVQRLAGTILQALQPTAEHSQRRQCSIEERTDRLASEIWQTPPPTAATCSTKWSAEQSPLRQHSTAERTDRLASEIWQAPPPTAATCSTSSEDKWSADTAECIQQLVKAILEPPQVAVLPAPAAAHTND